MGGAGQHDGRAGLLLAAGCTVGTARWAARKDAVIDDLLSGWVGLVWFGLSRDVVSGFLVSGFWFQQLSRHGLSPAVMPGRNPWRHEEPPASKLRTWPCAGA